MSNHVWHGGTVCHICQLRKKHTSNGFTLYRVGGKWTAKLPKCADTMPCEMCEDGLAVKTDPVTGISYHDVKDPISGRTTSEICIKKYRV